jgi:hypothetical protein
LGSPFALSLPNVGAYHRDMFGMNSQYFAADPSDLSLASDILLREEPEDEEENDEKDNDEEDDDGDEGYSE